MSERRSYQQFCGLARALDRVGERWTLLIVRNLLLGPRRYSDLLRELPGITTNLLAKRLKEMEELGILQRSAPGGRGELYALTARGEALEPAIMELARWGGVFMDAPQPGDRVDLGWGLLSLKRRYRGGLSLCVALQAGEREFELRCEPARLEVKERKAQGATLLVRAPEEVLRALFWQGADSAALRERGALEVFGAESELRSFLEAFAPAR